MLDQQASESFVLDGVEYPQGTYVVWMNQPKRGMANTILEDGLDLSAIPGLYFYSPPSVWSHPLLWGVYRAVMEERMEIKTHPINNADPPWGSAEGGKASAVDLNELGAIECTHKRQYSEKGACC